MDRFISPIKADVPSQHPAKLRAWFIGINHHISGGGRRVNAEDTDVRAQIEDNGVIRDDPVVFVKEDLKNGNMIDSSGDHQLSAVPKYVGPPGPETKGITENEGRPIPDLFNGQGKAS